MKNIEVDIITVLLEYKEMTQFFLNKKVRDKYNYEESTVNKSIDNLIRDRIIIRSDDVSYNLSKYGKYSAKPSTEVKLFLNPEHEFDKL
ncbi:MAG: hypothetical protein APF84_12520 [Gracilibacter sp. BRH_c7a]|nr:MAG: hypothetical protein APF84_12520 [Gracilibacter sp. BRH_c7a]